MSSLKKSSITIIIWIIVSVFQIHKGKTQSNTVPFIEKQSPVQQTYFMDSIYVVKNNSCPNHFTAHMSKLQKINDTTVLINNKFDLIEKKIKSYKR